MSTRQALAAGAAAGASAALTIASLVMLTAFTVTAEPVNQLLWQLSFPAPAKNR